MPFTPDPFAFTGTVDTSSTDSGAVPLTFRGNDEGATSDDKSVASVCPAFAVDLTPEDLATAAEARLLPSQSELNRTY